MMGKRWFLFGLVGWILFFSLGFGAQAQEFPIVEFKNMPDHIITNIPAFPVTGRVPETSEVFVNGQNATLNSTRWWDKLDFFVVVDLVEGANNITLIVIDEDGSEAMYDKQIEYDPAYSTEESELIYANVDYEKTWGVIVIDIERGYFLGIMEGQRIKGITKDGSEIILQTGERYSTKTHGYTGRGLPDYYGTGLLFSHDGNYVYYMEYKVNLSSNAIESNLSEYIHTLSDISQDDKRIVIPTGYIYTENNSFVELNYRNGDLSYMTDLVIDPTGAYVIHSSYGYADSKLVILDSKDASIVEAYFHDDRLDYAGDIVFSTDGMKLYAGYGGNPSYGRGGIQIIDMDTLNSDGVFWMEGPRSLAFSNDEKLYAFSTSSAKRGIVEMAPKNSRTSLETEKLYLVEPYDRQNSIFYKQRACRIDVNGDGEVGIFDLAAVGMCYGQAASGNCEDADVDGNGMVNIFDLAAVGLNYGNSC